MGEGKQDSQADFVKKLIQTGASEVFISGKMIGANCNDDDFVFSASGDFEDSHVLGNGEKPEELKQFEFWWIFD